MDQQPLLSLSNVSWCAGQTKILEAVSATITKGSFVGLIGPNGAGKSSLMRCIYRVNKPDSGSILFEGDNVWQLSANQNARNMAVILQEQSDHLGLSVYEVVALGLTPHKTLFEWDTPHDKLNIQKVLAENDLTHLSQRLFLNLSGGEKQRVMLARAMLQKPRLLLMDEPTNHLDVHYQVEVLRRVKQLDITVLASFHDLNLAAAFCDQIIVLDKGRVVTLGSPEDVLTEKLLSDTFNTQAFVDVHPVHHHPRITYAYHDLD